MKILKRIIIFIIIIIVIICVLIFLLNNFYKKNNNTTINENQNISNTYSKNFMEVSDYNIYFSIKDIINNYLLYIKQINGDIYINAEILTEDREEIKNKVIEKGIEGIKGIADISYINDFDITNEKILSELKKYKVKGNFQEDVDYDLDIKKIYTADKTENITIALVYGTLNDQEFNIIMKLDLKNNLYSIFGKDYIEKYQYNENTNLKDINIDDLELIKNNYNTFKFVNATMEYIVIQYFADYRNMLLNNPQRAYQTINDEYKNKRFTNYEDFYKYVELNKEKIKNSRVNKYMLDNFNDKSQYICIDQHGNYYIFTEKGIMDYDVILDTYTIDLPQFLEKYENGNNQMKVGMNIEKFITSINMKDYNYAYNCLAESFKANSYNTEEFFEEYIKNNFFDVNKIEYVSFLQEGDNFIYNIKLSDNQGISKEIKDVTVIMQLKEGTDFVMSFSIN